MIANAENFETGKNNITHKVNKVSTNSSDWRLDKLTSFEEKLAVDLVQQTKVLG